MVKAKAKSPKKRQYLGLRRHWLTLKKKEVVDLRHPMFLRNNEEFDDDFSSWLEKLLTNIKPLVSFKPHGDQKTHKSVHDSIMKHIRSFACCFYDIQRVGYCVSSEALKKENLVVVHDVIKFRNPYLLKFSKSRADKTFQKLRECILKWFFPNKEPTELPWELQNLLVLLDEGAWKKQLLVRHHIGFMSNMAIMNFVSSWHNVKPQLNKEQYKRYGQACGSLPQRHTWKGEIATNRAFLLALQKSKYKGKKFDLPRFSRNSMQHILEYSWEGKIRFGAKRPLTGRPNFSLREVVKMVMTYFSKSLSEMPTLLHDNRLLHLYCPKQYFVT